jgi:hypothetical protein
MPVMSVSGSLVLYHGTSASRIEHIKKKGLFPLEPPNNPSAHWMLTDSEDDAWSHARKWAERDHAPAVVITYRVPGDAVGVYLYVPDEPLFPDVSFTWYAVRKPLPESMMVTVKSAISRNLRFKDRAH